jgi:predicted AAA+ superfamily ATPase
MGYIHRSIEENILKYLRPNKAVVLLGARRVGKTKLIERIVQQLNEPTLVLNGDDQDTLTILAEKSKANYERLLGDIRFLVIDEAQEIPDIGSKLKLMVDTIEGIKILVTGSSVLDLNSNVGEPLVGRKMTFHLYPFSQSELSTKENYLETVQNLETRLIYGTYPELEFLPTLNEKALYLNEIINSYLLKDVLAYEGIQRREKIVSLLRIIAYRVGSEISIESIGNELGISKNTVDKYLDLLSKVFIIKRVAGFSRNLDNEITKKAKWYFYDNGIRNAIISNFNRLELRDDQGKLWENYLISERLKKQEYTLDYSSNYFWRTHAQQEIDWVEEKDGQLKAFEFKWSKNAKVKIPNAWKKGYPEATFESIDRSNYFDFITDRK